jgi:hypothetical protein
VARIVVSGYMIRHPVAGNLLAYFHYLLGLHRLGHQVAYVEESGWSGACYDPVAGDFGDDPGPGLRAVRALLDAHGVTAPACYVDQETGRVHGADWDDVKQMLKEADVLLNVGGVCWLPEFRLCRRRALIDMDPLFTQIGRFGAWLLDDHHVHFSYGANIGRAGCTIPTAGIDWLPTVPPIVSEIWQVREPGRAAKANGGTLDDAFTTVANWSSYGAVTYRGERYGQKDEEFLRLLDLPSHTRARLELALSGASSEERARLRGAGWSVRNASEVSAGMPTYQAYIAGSRGEFSAAKHAYVKTRSGWFSDRSVCYLAAGRPVVLQDTGFSDWLPTGRGIVAFTSTRDAADCLERVAEEYPEHCRAAVEVVTQVFNYDVVLPQLLEHALEANMGHREVVAPGRPR